VKVPKAVCIFIALASISAFTYAMTPIPSPTGLEVIDPNTSPGILQEVYLVKALDCSSPPTIRALTGFRVRQTADLPAGIITALHGIAGCQRRSAVNSAGEQFTGLHVERVSIPDDIALLTSIEISGAPEKGLRVDSVKDWHGLTNLEVAGHGYGAVGADIRSVVLPEPPQDRIGNIAVGSAAIDWLRNRGSPAINLTVASVIGFIAPGHSGAPLLIDGGTLETVRVIGMIDGGQPGFGGKSWAIAFNGVKWQPGNTPLPPSLISPDEHILYYYPSTDTGDPIREDSSVQALESLNAALHATLEEPVGGNNQFMRTAVTVAPSGKVVANVTIRNESALSGFCGKSGAAFYDRAHNLLQTVSAGSQWCVDGKLLEHAGSHSTRSESYQGVLDPNVIDKIAEIVIIQTPGGKNVVRDAIGDIVRARSR
jgi:hypothetical protein